MSLPKFVDAIRSKDWSEIPPKSVVVTLDDGHRGNYALLPIIKKYGVRPTIYVVTQVAGTPKHSWFAEVQGGRMDGGKTRAADPELEKQGPKLPSTAEYPDDTRQALNRSEMEEMSQWVDFESHTRTHPYLTACDRELVEREMRKSRTDLRDVLGRELNHFCYPDGHYGDREARLAAELGYASARTIDVGWNSVHSDPHRLRVMGVTDDASVNILAVQMTGLMMYFRYAMRGGWSGRYPITHRPSGNSNG